MKARYSQSASGPPPRAALVCYRDATSGDPASTRYAAVTRYAPVIHWGSR